MMTIDEAIRHCEDVANDKCGCAEDCVSEHRQLAEWLKELQRYQWIPCSERLPEYLDTVLLSTFFGVKVGFRDHTDTYGDYYEIIEDDADAGPHYIYAWMPLPKPWKGDNDE